MMIELASGKYTYLFHPDGRQEALRHGEPWRDLTGDKFTYCMAAEIAELTAERDALAQENKRLIEFVRKISEQTPEKPDYWSSCSQCEHNSSDAEDLLATVKDKVTR